MSTPTTRATPTPSAILTLPREGRQPRSRIMAGRRPFSTRRDHVGLSAPDDC